MNSFRINWQQSATEFVVIVVGVLAALAVDQWRSERNDRKTEVEYITRLRIDVEADIENFYRFERILDAKARFLQSLLDDTIDSAFAPGSPWTFSIEGRYMFTILESEAGDSDLDLNPIVLSLSVGYRF